METTKRQRMLERILRHGLILERIYVKPGNGAARPTSLCKALRRIEAKWHRFSEDICNGVVEMDDDTDYQGKAFAQVVRHLPLLPREHFHLNLDPRGYALKIESEHKPQDLPGDWGGYGILAPDLAND